VKKRPLPWIIGHLDVLANAGSLIGTAAVTSSIGFVYWWLAARWFSPHAIGLVSAVISAMILLGTFATLGLNTLLIGELPRRQGQELSLINAALILSGSTGVLVGGLFALIAPSFLPAFLELRMSIGTGLLFAAGVALTAISMVFDEAMIGLLKGEVQLYRNALFVITKLGVLVLVAVFLPRKDGLAMYATWVIGCAFSLVTLILLVVLQSKNSRGSLKPCWGALRNFGGTALRLHLLNLLLTAPALVLPILVTTLLSITANAWFYVSYMLASFIYIVPNALTMVLYAVNSAHFRTLQQKIHLTLGLSTAICIVANVLLFLGSRQILGLFGHSYAEQAGWCLRILGLCAFPMIIQCHYAAFHRIQGAITSAIIPFMVCDLLELSFSFIGALFNDLAGLSLGLLVAMCIEGLYMSRTVYRFARFGAIPGPVKQDQGSKLTTIST